MTYLVEHAITQVTDDELLVPGGLGNASPDLRDRLARAEEARADVPSAAALDPGRGAISGSSARVKNAFANGEALVRARRSSQSICSRSDRAMSRICE